MLTATPIESHAIIGDLHTVALVALDGGIDFLCFPRFDSPTIFAALLDPERGGRFEIAPQLDGVRHRQPYLPDSNILLTRFLAADGVAEISDFMPVAEVENAHSLVRRVKTVRGELAAYGHGLLEKPAILALSKADALTPEVLKQQMARLKRAAKKTPLDLSSASGQGVQEVLRALLTVIDANRVESGEKLPEPEEAWQT